MSSYATYSKLPSSSSKRSTESQQPRQNLVNLNNTDEMLGNFSSHRELKDNLVRRNKIVCVKVYGKNCGPCVTVSEPFAKLSDEYIGRCLFVSEDAELRLSNVQAVPTFLFYKEKK